ncbi:UDP-glucose/GDP-mannose dehydrogenase family protein [Phragmitibacter flavus]|uniref:UDP-glucose 6-dehydrogenase n=1 Tax=Phragmitibacter flavus TaxID=2576071 RepID=A0A5R8KHV0_9BACT|nr:nucleotide sugar dehydrogenase [Phragmitibacter flavus]TLD71555.1 UDP-glucose/GDP-mannose dehydrogenase family protein [Phragmitibacter flavus]
MKVSVFGLGYVGAVTSACLAEAGHEVIGVDVQKEKIEAFNLGRSPIVEPGLDQLLAKAVRDGALRATTDAVAAVAETQVSIVCVGTPSLPSGELNLDYVRHVSGQIAEALKTSGKEHVLIFRSTMLPGSTGLMVAEFFEELRLSGRVKIYYCPEFLREGTAVQDFRDPSLAVIGTFDGLAPADGVARQLLGGKPAALRWRAAEMIKYACNYFHAVKVGFANEIGRLCKQLGEDGQTVMEVVCADTKLNISKYYMRPGTPFGGSCLPKDVSALNAFADGIGVELPLLGHTLATNRAHLEALVKLILGKGKTRIGLLGLAFKADTDDLRGSPMVAVAEALLANGCELSIYDPQLNLARLIGANASEIQRRMPHLTELMCESPREVLSRCDVIVASQRCARTDELASAARADQHVVDVNGWNELKLLPWQYEGACW